MCQYPAYLHIFLCKKRLPKEEFSPSKRFFLEDTGNSKTQKKGFISFTGEKVPLTVWVRRLDQIRAQSWGCHLGRMRENGWNPPLPLIR
jgi:hypothetical protein